MNNQDKIKNKLQAWASAAINVRKKAAEYKKEIEKLQAEGTQAVDKAMQDRDAAREELFKTIHAVVGDKQQTFLFRDTDGDLHRVFYLPPHLDNPAQIKIEDLKGTFLE